MVHYEFYSILDILFKRGFFTESINTPYSTGKESTPPSAMFLYVMKVLRLRNKWLDAGNFWLIGDPCAVSSTRTISFYHYSSSEERCKYMKQCSRSNSSSDIRTLSTVTLELADVVRRL
jgi:hypothetical protein